VTGRAGLIAVNKPSVPQAPFLLRRSSAGSSCNTCMQDDDHDDEQRKLQRKETGSLPFATRVPPIVHEVLRSPGQPLAQDVRAVFVPHFGLDFSAVRVHTDAKAAESARSVNALAYTVGQDVVFGAGQYAPQLPAGRRLIAHELTHTVQQRGASAAIQPAALNVGTPSDATEQEAQQAERAIDSGQTYLPRVWAHPVIARQTRPGSSGTPPTQQSASGAPPTQLMGWNGQPINVTAPPPPAVNPPVSQPTPPPVPWANCRPDRISGLNQDLAQATSWVDEAVRDLQSAQRPAHTTGALNRFLSSDPNDIANTILPRLQDMQAELHGGSTNFQCQTQQQCSAIMQGGDQAAAISTSPISLCERYFSLLQLVISGVTVRPMTLIHETGHHAGLGGDTYEWTWPFPGLSVHDRLQNADSFAAFVATNHSQWLPPATGPTGSTVTAGAGVMFGSGPRSPRFVVTAAYDVTMARRVLHFFDLHLGVTVDVDMAGTVVATPYIGPRIFAPTSLTSLPVYLDLQAGYAVGNDPTQVDAANRAIQGISGEARLGVQSGHFAGGIGYRHIFNLMRSNADINQLAVYGEILF